MTNKIDRHGYVDIQLDGWDNNIRFDRAIEGAVIAGVSVNALLYGIFILHGYDEEERKLLTGGYQCWDHIMEAIYCNLSTIVTVYELISRVRVLCEQFILRRRKYLDTLVISKDLNFSSNLLYGSLVFLHTWVANFNEYISDANLTNLRKGIVCLGNLGLRHVLGMNAINQCGGIYRRLEVLMDIVTKERTILVSGVSSTLHTSPSYCPMKYLSSYDLALYDFIMNEQVYTEIGPFKYLYHRRNYLAHTKNTTLPLLAPLKGSYDMEALQKRQEAKKALENASKKFKLEVFGGDNLLDMDSDESDLDEDLPRQSTLDNSKPIPQIVKDLSLIESPISMQLESADTDLWSYELLELARQLTLIDQAMFCAIPMTTFLDTSWSSPRHCLMATEYKRFSDRFNSLSLWATTCVLRESDINERAEMYSKIVMLASHLLDLGNHHAAMALVTSLKQGCITRLYFTLEKVEKKTKEIFLSMQNRLSDSKNYATYRQELDRIDFELVDSAAWKSREDGMDARLKKRNLTSNILNEKAYIPFLGVFIGDLAAIHDGNTNYFPEGPHLINIHKYKVITKVVQILARMQQVPCNLEPIRTIAASWNHLMKSYAKLTMKQSKQASENLFRRSTMLESDEDIEQASSRNIDDDMDDDVQDSYPSGYNPSRDELGGGSKSKKSFSFKKLAKSIGKSFSSKKKTL